LASLRDLLAAALAVFGRGLGFLQLPLHGKPFALPGDEATCNFGGPFRSVAFGRIACWQR
jgi:hypothetical protein